MAYPPIDYIHVGYFEKYCPDLIYEGGGMMNHSRRLYLVSRNNVLVLIRHDGANSNFDNMLQINSKKFLLIN